jgi:hypothetical protein
MDIRYHLSGHWIPAFAGMTDKNLPLHSSLRRKPESVRLQAGAIGEVKVLSQEMPAPDS